MALARGACWYLTRTVRVTFGSAAYPVTVRTRNVPDWVTVARNFLPVAESTVTYPAAAGM